jgi:hypothetical protein
MLSIVLIEGELRSLIRNSLERIIGKNFNKKYNKNLEILLKISIRAVSSLIAITLFQYIKQNPTIREYSSYILLIIFILFVYNEQ